MECRASLKNQKEKKGGPQPRRGQVKAKIFSMLFRSLIPKGLKKKGEKKLRECERAITPAPYPALRIEWCVRSEDKQLLLWKGLVKADGSSAAASPEKRGIKN